MNDSKSTTIKVRQAQPGDIPGMLEIEKSRYSELYENDSQAIKEVEDRFKKRIEVATGWMWVAERKDEILGFITGQPTNSEPKDFKSWEESTDNGTLETTLVPDGKNVYVVNLDVSKEAAKENAQYMLMAQLGAKCIRKGKEKVIFESRMPEFRTFITNHNAMSIDEWNDLSDERKFELAEEYSNLKINRNGKLERQDRLLRFYDSGGFNLEKVFANAFKDPESLDFGMLCTGENPVPKLFRIKPINFLVSKIFEKVGNNPKLLTKLVR